MNNCRAASCVYQYSYKLPRFVLLLFGTAMPTYSCNVYTCYCYVFFVIFHRLMQALRTGISSMIAGGKVIHWTLLGSAELCKCHKKMNGYTSEVAKLVILC